MLSLRAVAKYAEMWDDVQEGCEWPMDDADTQIDFAEDEILTASSEISKVDVAVI